MDNEMTKPALRMKALDARRQITEKYKKSAIITHKVIQLIQERKYQSIGIYMALEDEVHTRDIVAYCFANKISVAVPKIEQGIMNFYWITSFDEVHPGHFSVLEPTTNQKATKIALQIVPMVAFDEFGNRIGYGKGYYDRYLQNFQGDVIGIAYEKQCVTQVPADEFDQRLPMILTEVKEYRIS